MRSLIAFLLVCCISAPALAVPGDQIYARPGELFDAGDGARLNFVCIGNGSPTVVFEAAFSDWAPVWAIVQPRVAQFTRACSYDRAGLGFSEPGPMPRTTERIATELHAALRNGGIAGPYILVGSAFGGDHVRAFADLYPVDVAGLVLLDGDASDVDSAENRLKEDQRALEFVPGLKKCRDAIAAGDVNFGLPPPPGRPPKTCAQRLFRSAPMPEWSPELNAKEIEIGQHNVALWDASISEMQAIGTDELWLQEHRTPLGNRPVRILTSGNHGAGNLSRLPPVSLDRLRYVYETALAQSRWLTLSTDAKQIFVNGSSEYIQLDQPNAVVEAVREIYDLAAEHKRTSQH